MADLTPRPRSRSRSFSRERSPPRRRDDRRRSRSPPRRPRGSSRQRYSHSPDRRFGHSPQRRLSRSPPRKPRDSPRRSFDRSPRRRFSRSPTGRGRDPPRERPGRSAQQIPSRSPPRRRYDDKPKNGRGGFRWKEKNRENDRHDQGDDRRLTRGYRDQEKIRAKSPVRDMGRPSMREEKPTEKPKKEKRATQKTALEGETIIVNVNDRLGTKVAIPCLASDPIKLFKAMVAAHIGRKPHEIMLKRQGERPFKDQLTLEDYGVSNGVQLDLEVDTGD